jgi:hypothetical protein
MVTITRMKWASSGMSSNKKLNLEHTLEARIAHTLQNRAAHINSRASYANHIIQGLPSPRRTANHRRFFAPAFALAGYRASCLFSWYLSPLKPTTILPPLCSSPGYNGSL